MKNNYKKYDIEYNWLGREAELNIHWEDFTSKFNNYEELYAFIHNKFNEYAQKEEESYTR